MLKKGFTLTELLITMTIVGVVAALSAPWIMMNNRNAANAAKLGTVMSDLENALTSMVIQENVDSINETTAWKNISSTSTFINSLGKYIAISTPSVNSYTHFLLSNGFKKGSATTISGTLYQLKNGAYIYVSSNSSTDSADAKQNIGGNLGAKCGTIIIDVNGTKSPNVVGRDTFKFFVNADGSLYPLGGKDVSIYETGSATKGYWNNNSSTYACTSSKIGTSGYGCTARVIEENFKPTF